MKFNDEYREKMFYQARELSPLLGSLFQNPMELTPNDLEEEIQRARQTLNQEHAKYEKYIAVLGTALCFPHTLREHLESDEGEVLNGS